MASRAGLNPSAFDEARKHSNRWCTTEHFMLALLSPPHPTPASEVLNDRDRD